MNKKFKIMIAEDTKVARDIIFRELVSFNAEDFLIDKCETPDKAFAKLSESINTKDYYDITFIDIDFTEAKGGHRDSGFQIINRAFDVCPLTKICTYSGQFREIDLSPQHEEMVKKGLVVKSFDKSHREAGGRNWFRKNLEEVLHEMKNELFLWDIWENQRTIIEKIKNMNLSSDPQECFLKQYEIISNLENLFVLLKNSSKFSSDVFLNRLVIFLYQNCLEIFCAQDKTDAEIFNESEINKKNFFGFNNKRLEFDSDKPTALRKIAAHSDNGNFKYGHRLNHYRNKSLHPNQDFKISKTHIIFANLTLSIYILGKENVFYKKIKEVISEQEMKILNGINDLKEIIDFLES